MVNDIMKNMNNNAVCKLLIVEALLTGCLAIDVICVARKNIITVTLSNANIPLVQDIP